MISIINNVLHQPDIVLMNSFCGDHEEIKPFTNDYARKCWQIPEIKDLYNADIIKYNDYNEDIYDIEVKLFPTGKPRYEYTKNDVLKIWNVYIHSQQGKLNVTKTCSFIRNYLKELLVKYKDKLSYENCVVLFNKCKAILSTIQSNKDRYNVSFIKMWKLNRVCADIQKMLKYSFDYKPQIGDKVKSFYQELSDIVS